MFSKREILGRRLALLQSFANFFNVWFHRRQLDFHISYYIQSVAICSLKLVGVYEENISLQKKYLEGKEFSDNSGYFSLVVRQNL